MARTPTQKEVLAAAEGGALTVDLSTNPALAGECKTLDGLLRQWKEVEELRTELERVQRTLRASLEGLVVRYGAQAVRGREGVLKAHKRLRPTLQTDRTDDGEIIGVREVQTPYVELTVHLNRKDPVKVLEKVQDPGLTKLGELAIELADAELKARKDARDQEAREFEEREERNRKSREALEETRKLIEVMKVPMWASLNWGA
jgi:NurA-like 5'-3' nuclease